MKLNRIERKTQGHSDTCDRLSKKAAVKIDFMATCISSTMMLYFQEP